MMNNLVVVGRLTKVVDLKERAIITLACSRPFKNEEGEYETDFIDFYINGSMKRSVIEYCKQGDVMGIKGRIQTKVIDDAKVTELIADKVTFLSSNANLKKEEE